ncbi:LexA family transcriptional regulator [Flavobacterium sp. GT3R68]|uniref:XRE family transcriptional regulator n=1 Tax=Flavobacterium sp. GT3R68 TaxID=2594437 RepID=UPI000F861E76|nr:LexA family transcriptional regulator [Flavobacterium sp. GT3R68]RTY91801.1 helix-turn-helix domain-containing protein [Flavobacterium sp. GSN2]TRW90141.1 helix-turn-helix domain-containing protein [Flavobacterium sp. GT3R68]
MLYISDNLKWLRNKQNLSQQEVADGMKLPVDRYKKYEYGKNVPPAETLLLISRYFHISIDLLLTVDLSRISIDNLLQLEDNRILLPIKVDGNGDNLIEIVPHKAKAGYANGYADPEFIESLQHISLPFLRNGKFRAFPVDGDSMPPHKEGSFVVGQYVEKLGDVMDGKTYIVVTKSQGIVYKRLNKNGKNALMLISDNTVYSPYEVKASEILEIWEYACSIATKEFTPDDMNAENVKDMLRELRKEIREVGNKLS